MVEVGGPMGADDLSLLVALAEADAGIALLPLTDARLAQGPLRRILPDWRAGDSALYLVYPSARHLPPKLTAFRDFVVAWADGIRSNDR